MRRIAVLLALVVAVWPASSALAGGSTTTRGTAAGRMQADFNDDGFADLAVAAPFEDIGTVSDAGAVHVLYGTPTGLTATGTQLLTQDSPGVPGTAEVGDDFGFALAAGDFDNDGFADLAVGVPGEDLGGGFAAEGGVNVLYGAAGGLTGGQLFTQDSPGVPGVAEVGDVFGATLAAGDFDNDGADDLAVGASGEDLGGVEHGGAVNVLFGAGGGLTGIGGQLFTQDSPGVGDSAEDFDAFGETLAAGGFDNDGFDDLAVGVSREDVGSVFDGGAVNVLPGTAGGLTGTGSQLFTQDSPGVGSIAEQDDDFGFALAAGDFDNNGFDDLAVGVPFEDVGAVQEAGAINVLPGTAGGLTGTGSQLFTQDSPGVPGVAESDVFGERLAAADFDNDGFADLAVGAPGEDIGTIVEGGAVNVVYGTAGGLTGTGSQLFTQDSPGMPGMAEDTDLFAEALAASGPQSATAPPASPSPSGLRRASPQQ